ncbi:nicotinamide riboside transporter PnuC [uncultured Shewanella sp.]|uniref:nicotinamide riboside transporter PnuC n=1 Tax=uncultured Shewanella sp. TaxID=173975 RepID=UPI002639E0CD|nr:nicotinamide riboside transporter PnuC [uncultured Shewanella sp.]
MNEVLPWYSVLSDMRAMTMWETIAVFFALAYLLLAMKQSRWCWIAAFVSTSIYTVIFWHVSLLMESALNFYYIGMAMYGYWVWTQGGDEHKGIEITSLALASHAKIIGLTSIASIVVGYCMANYTHAAFPYLDAATTCFAVVTTYLVAKKVLENWLYWVVIDLVSIYLYFSKGLMLTSLLFVFYVIIAIVGFMTWNKRWRVLQQNHATAMA